MLVQHPETVAIVTFDGDELILVRQRGAGAGGLMLDIPAGEIEPDERPPGSRGRRLTGRDEGETVSASQ
jgi:8-oxo-dGTP pyrophosphatase MutT (NUDIX family)